LPDTLDSSLANYEDEEEEVESIGENSGACDKNSEDSSGCRRFNKLPIFVIEK
jgi:hypothetical protein